VAAGAIAGLFALVTAAAAAPASPAVETFGVQGPAIAAKSTLPPRVSPAQRLGVDLGNVPELHLPALDHAALIKEGQEISLRTKRQRFGVERTLSLGIAEGEWHTLADGSHLWAADVVSTGAIAVRLRFHDVALPAGAELALYAPAGGDGPQGPEAHRVELRTAASAPTTFWSGMVGGDRIRVELLLPAGTEQPARLPFTVDRLMHAYLDPIDFTARNLTANSKAAGSCENDVSCYPDWTDLSHAVSLVAFDEAGGSFLCSGQLMNDVAGDLTPYYLTANHCISTGDGAASASFYWLYQTPNCNGAPPSVNSVPRSDAAQLLSTSPSSDYTLLMVLGGLPDGLYWSGWTSKAPSDGTDAVAIHHPAGDYKRISFGMKNLSQICNEDAGTNSIALTRIEWNSGVTEPGSSGSGIFRADTGQLFGQLFFGPSACGVSSDSLYDCYGSFSSTYLKTRKWWTSGSDDSSEQNDSCGKARLVRNGTLNNRIVKIYDEDWYRISVPAGKHLDVTLSFTSDDGQIGLEGYSACGGDPGISLTNGQDGEAFEFTNLDTHPVTIYWRVFLTSSTRNLYNMVTSTH
jgi:hypothetical protein